MKTCIGILASLTLIAIGTPVKAEPKPTASLVLQGAYPSRVVPLPGGAIAFSAYAEDGNRRAVHVLDGATLRRTTVLPRDRELVVLDDAIVVAAYRGFDIYDAKSAALLKHKQFKHVFPPQAGAYSHWLEGNILTLIQGENYADSSLRRIRLPQMEVIERFDAPVTGAFTRWNDKFVAIGALRGANGNPRPSITVLDSSFRIVAHSDIEPSKVRNNGSCSVTEFAKPLVMGDLLVYGSDCGGMRVHDLKNMRQVAAREPLSAALILDFAVVDGRLLATGIDNEGASIDEIELPSLRPTRLLRVSGKHFAASGANLYAFRNPAESSRPITIDVYSNAGLKAEHPLSDTVLNAQRAALSVLQGPKDIAASVAVMRPAIPRLSTSDVRTLTPAAMRAFAWYTGLLAQVNAFTKEVAPHVEALLAAAPDDTRIRALADSATAWVATLNPQKQAAKIPFLNSTLTTGELNGVIARTLNHVTAARWCESLDIPNGSRTPAPRAEPDSAATALAACYGGEVGLAVHDPQDLRFLRYIPIIKSEGLDQENIDAILTFANIAVVSIERRYPNDSLDSLVSVDLDSGAVLARSKMGLQTDPAPTQAIACLRSSCAELDPRTLKPGTSPLADGVALSASLLPDEVTPPDSPYVFVRRDELLEARDRVSNAFVCAWPVVLKGWATGLFYNPQGNMLVVAGTTRSPEDLAPSVTIDVPTLIAAAKNCAQQTATNKTVLDLAMRELQ